VNIIKNKECQIKNELNKIVTESGIYLSKEVVIKISDTIKDIFFEGKYLSRLVRFSEGVIRKASGYGIEFDLHLHRFYLANTGYQIGVKNAVRAAYSKIESDLALCRHKSAPGWIVELNKWRSYLAIKPVYATIALLFLLLVVLVASIGASDITEFFF